jgi:hypothetical protein
MSRRILVGVSILAAACTGKSPTADWTEDTRVDGASAENDPDSFGTRMCVSPDGKAIYVLWMDDRDDRQDGTNDIWMNRSLDLGQSWLDVPVKVNQGNPDVKSDVWNPDLYCNEIGAFVVWEDDRDGVLHNHQIYYNYTTDLGQTFQEEDLLLETDLDGNSMSLEPKITGYGQNLFVAWYDSINGAYDIFSASSSDGGKTWRPPVRVDSDDPPGSAYSARPKIATSRNGSDVWIVWEDSRDGAADIYFARSDNGGTTFKEDQRLDGGDVPGEHDSFEPQICTDQANNLYTVWHDSRSGENKDIYFNYSSNLGADWNASATYLETDAMGFTNSLFPVCAEIGPNAYVAWYSQANAGEGYDIWARQINSGNPKGDPQRLDIGDDGQQPSGYANSTDPRIAVADDGTVAVAWADYRGEATSADPAGYDDLYYNYLDPAGTFKTDTDLRVDSMYSGQSFKKDLNFQLLGGSWFAAWTDGRGGTTDIYFQTFEIGTQSNPPNIEDLQAQQAGQ